MKIKEICSYLESIAPLTYQEHYDNSGLLVGNPEWEVNKVLLCLDSTPPVVEEAVKEGCNLIIAHHPILFSPLKRLTGATYVENTIINAIKHDVAIYAAHTNLDSVRLGVNRKICEKLGLIDCRVLRSKSKPYKKLFTFCPEKDADRIRAALFDAGGGQIGNYDQCSFNVLGTGTFRGGEDSKPHVGKAGKQTQQQEVKIEMIYPAHLETTLIAKLLTAHPYEEVAYDIIALDNVSSSVGFGMIGALEKPMEAPAFLNMLKKCMEAEQIRHTKLLGSKIKNVAVCGGAGSFLLSDAIRASADAFVSADFKYHEFFDADGQILVADIGHYESEHFTSELISDFLTEKFSNFAVLFSKINTNPIKYM